MLKVEKLYKIYNGFKAISDISFEVKLGEVVGLIGPNGAGKTTTLKIIKGILRPSTGTFSINNIFYSKTTNNTALKQLTGFLPENSRVIPYLTVQQFLELVSALYDVPIVISEKRISVFLKLFGLETRKHSMLEELSEGMKQKILWISTLLHDPPLVLLDDRRVTRGRYCPFVL